MGALAAATAYVVLASLVTWAVTRTNPIEMIEQMYTLAQGWIDHPDPRINEQHPIGISSFSSLMLALHVDRKVATPLAAITGFLLAGVLMWLWRNGRTLTLFAIAATTGRLWSYHHPYDDVTLIFLIVALGELVLTHRSRGTVFAFCLVGLSLWRPYRRTIPWHCRSLKSLSGCWGWRFCWRGSPDPARSKIRSTSMKNFCRSAIPGASRV